MGFDLKIYSIILAVICIIFIAQIVYIFFLFLKTKRVSQCEIDADFEQTLQELVRLEVFCILFREAYSHQENNEVFICVDDYECGFYYDLSKASFDRDKRTIHFPKYKHELKLRDRKLPKSYKQGWIRDSGIPKKRRDELTQFMQNKIREEIERYIAEKEDEIKKIIQKHTRGIIKHFDSRIRIVFT